ncbi:hypothetical protein BP6252_00534 [Coleophoma cylindrospora]|uniref:Uncharacterized protein n=1 Tax=Coleophoma cylindrospora TaxID=1849047 RepID=A0A3D8SQD8_9HELO|nr:hypothetical protein BP6252_00534 [Coleophoma cylindrospora]
MIDTSLPQVRRLTAPSRRRTSRATNQRHAALNYYLNLAASPSPGSPASQIGHDLIFQPSPGQNGGLGYFNYLNLTTASPGGSGPQPVALQPHDQGEDAWSPTWLGTESPASISTAASNFADTTDVAALHDGFHSQPLDPPLGMSWEQVPLPPAGALHQDHDELSMLEAQMAAGSYGSFEYVTCPSPNTFTSSMSEGYVIPSANTSLYGSPRSPHDQIQDFQSNDYFQQGQIENMSSPNNTPSPTQQEIFSFETDGFNAPTTWSAEDRNSVWTSLGPSPATVAQTFTPHYVDANFPFPWTAVGALAAINHAVTGADIGAFHTVRGGSTSPFQSSEAFIEGNSTASEASSPNEIRQNWQEYDQANLTRNDAHYRKEASWQHVAEHHSHIFSVKAGIEKSKPQRGRMRPLTTKGKREALEVRNAGACWACHLSKVKCSPFSRGSTCEQCSRLHGKRRFCHLPCFNDPIEALNGFLIPDYLTGHFTSESVEAFLGEYASGWGTETLTVRVQWGSRQPLHVDVVTLVLRGRNAELGFQHQAIVNGDSPILIKKKSPPIAIPPSAMAQMEEEFTRELEDCVKMDLESHVRDAYQDQESEFAGRLFEAMCKFYQAGLQEGDECKILRTALEVHVICSMLGNSLVLDQGSLNLVSSRTGQVYEPNSSARCAQRQMKLTLFMAQKKRIIDCLQQWHNLMWATTGTSTASANHGHRWVTSFSVFMVLLLVMDRTLVAARYYCEGNIRHHGADAATERSKYHQVLISTRVQLFERCKEIFHSRFKTRKAGKESCNPIRDGWRGRQMAAREEQLVDDVKCILSEFSGEIRKHRATNGDLENGNERSSGYYDAGRLSSLFLGDFLNL